MKIKIIYPSERADDFPSEINSINEEIDEKNRETAPARLIGGLFSALSYIVIIPLSLLFLWLSAYIVTARSLVLIILSFIADFLFINGLISLVSAVTSKLRHMALGRLGIAEFEESYTSNPYVERNDETKQTAPMLAYYRMCDLLRASEITDVGIRALDSMNAEVTLDFNKPGGQVSNTVMTLPYHSYGKDKDSVVIDFGIGEVIFPSVSGRGPF